MRTTRFLIATAVIAGTALVAGCGGGRSDVEQAVSDRYGVDVNCTTDHRITATSGREVSIYNCSSRGGSDRQFCVAFSDGRLLGARDLKDADVPAVVCKNQG